LCESGQQWSQLRGAVSTADSIFSDSAHVLVFVGLDKRIRSAKPESFGVSLDFAEIRFEFKYDSTWSFVIVGNQIVLKNLDIKQDLHLSMLHPDEKSWCYCYRIVDTTRYCGKRGTRPVPKRGGRLRKRHGGMLGFRRKHPSKPLWRIRFRLACGP